MNNIQNIKINNDLNTFEISYETNGSLSKYTSFNIGGKADYIVKPKNIKDIVNILKIIKKHEIDYFFLGNGSNLLVCDNGYRGMIILTCELNQISLVNKNSIECYAGVTVSKLCKFAYKNSLSGLEFAWGIPGSVGGGVYMNAGAYGGEFKDIIKSCKYVNEDGNMYEINISKMDMSYRHSFFTNKKLLIISAVFELRSDEQSLIKERMDDYITRRKNKQPLEYPSCGSTFKRPKNGYASALIEECGLKGYRIGGAEVSTKHSGFIINVDNAKCEDVLKLIEHVKKVVYEKKGITLECEVKILGI